ncbi:hypothetical protein Q4E40_02550 [Pontibacter sp. BT731]|uniref:phage tail protein n=1 Tax=Pontibacter coccineus TaxID=3063328 RepID=UPI0026E18020|nr:phage tail protein [Pontibacter sp. BT731]MDO6388992.1 hypothetical protein [Pontibacter sp. BT731]
MHYTIQRGTQDILTIRPEGTLTKRLMGENIVQFTFDAVGYTELRLGDTVTVFGETHYLNRLPQIEKLNSREYRYTCVFETVAYDLGKIAYLMMGDDNSLKETDFALMGNADAFLDLLLKNANRVQSGWTKGMVDSTIFKNLTFSKENCLQVLSKIAMEFNTEFWVVDKTIHLSKRGPISGLTFEYGKGKGLYRLDRKNKDGANVLTRLYAYGSTNNLKDDYRNFSTRLLLPLATGPYLEKNVSEYGVIEHAEIWEDIFPRRESTVTAVGDMFTFYDSAMDFNLNDYLLPGESAKVTFNSGQLAGYTFEIIGYNNAAKAFSFKKNEEEKSLEIPNEYLKPYPGDEYVLVDIFMPETYVTAAENELQTRAQEYLDQNSVPRVLYSVECDPLHFQREGVYISLGSFVQVKDEAMGVDLPMRVIALTRDVANGYRYTLELSEAFTIPQILRQYAQADKLNKYISQQERPVQTAPPFVPRWYPLLLGPGSETAGATEETQRAEYMKDSHGLVHLRGVIYCNNTNPGHMFTLPIGHRPGRNVWFNPVVLGGYASMMVWASGVASFFSPSPKPISVHLNGLYFQAEDKYTAPVSEPPTDTPEHYVRLKSVQVSGFFLDCSGIPTYEYSIAAVIESNKSGTYTLSNQASGRTATVTFAAGDTVKSIGLAGNREFFGGDPYSVTIHLSGADAGQDSLPVQVTNTYRENAATACETGGPGDPQDQ